MNQKILSFCAAIVAITSAFGVVMAATPVIDLGHNYAFSEGVSDGGWGEYYKGWQIVEMEDYAEDSYGGGSPWVFNYGVDQHDNICIPVTGCGTEKIVPTIMLGTATEADGLSATVWTDEEFAAKIHIGEHDFEEDDDEYYYENEEKKIGIYYPSSAWPTGRIVDGRQWIIVSLKNVKIGSDGFFSPKTFTVGIEESDQVTPTITLIPDDVLPATSKFTPTDIFGLEIRMNGLLNSQSVHCSFDPFFDLWDGVGVLGAGQIPYTFDIGDPTEEGGDLIRNLTISIPSAGELYLKIENGYDAGRHSWNLQLENLQFSGSAYGGSVRTVGNAQRWSGDSYWVVASTKSAGYLTIDIGDFEKLLVNGIWFRPSTIDETQCLATEAWYREEIKVANGMTMAKFRGFVTGLGLVKFGNKASLVCHPNEGETLDHWEFLNCTAPVDATVNDTNLTFTVTQALYNQIEASSDNPIKRVIVRPVFRTVEVTPVQNEHGKVQLWKNGPYWATTNIGAEKPEDYGYHFWWGDTVGYERHGDAWVASDGSNSNFSFSSCNIPTYNKNIDVLKSEGWITSAEVLAPEHDAAHVHWGENWRMPTNDELDALNSKCDWTWTTQNGVNGYVVSGRGDYAQNSIFLPASGTSFTDVGLNGYYRSSVPNSGVGPAWSLNFYPDFHDVGYYSGRDEGQSVRAVQEVSWVPIESPDPIPLVVSNDDLAAALAGTTDASLTVNVTNVAQYAAYRTWALSITNATTTAQMIKESTRTWLSYAFGADALIAKELTSDDVKIESFTPASTDGQFEFTVSVKDVNIGGGSVEVETLKENLKKVLGIEGAATLSPGGFSSDNIDITFDAPVDGKARFTVSPPADAGSSFFMRVKVK